MFKQFKRHLRNSLEAASFLRSLERVVGIASRILALSLVVVIFVAAIQLGISILAELIAPPYGQFETDLFKIFGLILDVLIAIELLENVTFYLKRNVFQVELVIVTALIAVARKIIILDFSATPGLKLIGLGLAIVALATSYWLVKQPIKNNSPPA
ncbi:phosphate-starvation-inducible PsiE family protein [Synechococcus sp. PCC 7336]|uniref:phosphate-starvation-inducible PsiE family protein n=1 Tax=Synechococcus sp. PCC 7336 TaxID=195250 RepID=UPI0003475E90|nr:phosphate-starvation-inducible PsiE family protein [Synechococcus sp. PCC 7336]